LFGLGEVAGVDRLDAAVGQRLDPAALGIAEGARLQ
jgi:hypothetical protein